MIGFLHLELCIQSLQLMEVKGRSMMHARIFFSMCFSDNPQKKIKLFEDIAQPYNTVFETTEIEVGPPVNHRSPQYSVHSGPYNDTVYRGAFNHADFSDYVENAYRSVMPFSGGTEIIMRQNTFTMGHRFMMSLCDSGASGW